MASVVTAAIAIAVGSVAFRQWRTAKDKFVFDLFERRYSVFDRAMSGLAQAIRDGDTEKNSSIRDVALARGEATFLFDEDVLEYLAEVQRVLAELGLARTQYRAQDKSENWPKRSYDASIWIMKAYEGGLAAKFAPYLKMTHKLQ
jgi:hypothetical protein